MATCKDCLHEKACVGMLEAMGYKVGTDYKGNADRCNTYTPKSQYAEVKHGEWVSIEGDVIFACSICDTNISTSWDYEEPEMWKYCPHCGAKMDGGKDG